jgi:hypothetical protein
MTNVYCANVVASFTTNTDSLAVEITAAANTKVKIKKIRIMHDDGTATVTSDYYKNVKLVTESVAGTGGSSFTPIALDGNTTASTSTVKTGAFTKGTITDNINVVSIHSVTDFYWSAADEDDKIVLTPGGIFGVVVNPAG